MAKLEVTCAHCNKKERFVDTKDITYNKWHIIGWNVLTAQAIVTCDECPAPSWERKEEEPKKKTKKNSKDVEKLKEDDE